MNYCKLCVENHQVVLRAENTNSLVATLKHTFASDDEAKQWALGVLIPAVQAGRDLNPKHWRKTKAAKNAVYSYKPSRRIFL